MSHPGRGERALSAGDPSASIDELAVIVEAIPTRHRALVLLCAWCALRSGEVLELRRKDVDIAAGTVRVFRAVSWVGGQPIVGTAKSAAGTRVVSIPLHVIPAVAHHLETMTAASPDALLFPGRDGVAPAAVDAPSELADGAGGRRPSGPAGVRPSPYRRHDGGASWRDPC